MIPLDPDRSPVDAVVQAILDDLDGRGMLDDVRPMVDHLVADWREAVEQVLTDFDLELP